MRRPLDDLGTQLGVGREHAMEANAAGVGATGMLPANPRMDALHEMEPWTPHEHGQALHELQRRHHDMGGTVVVRTFELQHDITGTIAFEAFVGNENRRSTP